MTNYNRRLDEVLHINGVKDYGVTVLKLIDVNEAKQAITSLNKELVAEAEPVNKQGEIAIDEPAYNDGYWSGAYNALEKFKQNLLKALEEK